MPVQTSQAKTETYRRIPKVELHRHLEGSLRLGTLFDLARTYSVTLPLVNDLEKLVQVQGSDPLTFTNFLSKFQTLRRFFLSPEVIQRITHEAVVDAAEDGIQHLELRFTPVALSRSQDFLLSSVMDWVCSSAAQAAQERHISVRLIASVNRHEPPELAAEVAHLAAERIPQGLVGLDLAGNEAEFDAQPFARIFQEARQAGLSITIHAGEWGGAANVRQAIEVLGAVRIGHGIRVLEDPAVVELARQRGTVFEVCLTSNYQSGVVPSMVDHPLLAMIQAGLRATLNTDDPGISSITLSDEYRLACDMLGLPLVTLHSCILEAAEAAFLEPLERKLLVSQLRMALRGRVIL
ncbi:MAG: adenosine deaminase [Chloroflexi bacterium]|nr:adenosine deaminase [Anaerolineaceae bacterium]NMB90998.1 adenosine deaminase [Chloroflexota bacterium]